MSFGWDTVVSATQTQRDCLIKRTFPAAVSELDSVLQFLSELAETAEGACAKQCDRLLIIAEELFVNIASYAYAEGGDVDVSCIVTKNPSCIHVLFSDTGAAFDPMQRTEADAAASVATLTPGGLGILMAKKMADDMAYRWQNGENQMYIRKVLS